MMFRDMMKLERIRELNWKVSTPMLLYDASTYTGDAWVYAGTGLMEWSRVCQGSYIEEDDAVMADLKALGGRVSALSQEIEDIKGELDILLMDTVRDMEEDERMPMQEMPSIASMGDDEKVVKKGVDALLEVVDMWVDLYYAYMVLDKAAASMAKAVQWRDLEGEALEKAAELSERLSKCKDDMLKLACDTEKVSRTLRKRMMEEMQ